ncbi:MAG: transcription antitermination factor NusB [Bacilli bacterium]|nr:transcription antitermination factor NusB [Bacilli bacterium]
MAELNRSMQREIIMTSLYQIFIYEANKIEYDIKEVIKSSLEIENNFINEIVYGVLEKREELDNVANKYLKNWSIDRLGKTDQAIIRMAIYEIMYTDTPNIVCINEAVELAKAYSDDKVKSMINGILDSISQSIDNGKDIE